MEQNFKPRLALIGFSGTGPWCFVNPPPFYRLWRHQFNSQGQLCLLTCAEWRDLSDHTRMSTIQSRTPETKAKKSVTLTWKFPWKSGSTTQLPLVSSNRKILKAFQKKFPPQWSLLNSQQKKKYEARKAQKEGRRESEKKKSRLLRALKRSNEILLPAHAQTSQPIPS